MSRPGSIIDPDHPKSRLGTPQHTGPYSRLRVDTLTKLEQGHAVFKLLVSGQSIRAAARTLGMSRMTAWRRVWFVHDCANGGGDPIPHQRSTKAVPRGAPWLLPRDADLMLRQLLDSGPELSADVIFRSVHTVPGCVRAQALRILVAELMGPDEFVQFEERVLERLPPAPPRPYIPSPASMSHANRRGLR